MADYVQAALMLAYNGRKIGLSDQSNMSGHAHTSVEQRMSAIFSDSRMSCERAHILDKRKACWMSEL